MKKPPQVPHDQDNLQQSEERYRAFIAHSTEGIMRFELEKPVPISLPEDEAIDLFYRYGYLAECNDRMAQMYGFQSADELVGARLGDLLVRSDPGNVEYLRAFIRAGYKALEAESREVDRDGRDKYFLNTITGIVEDGCLVRAWGVQRDITDQKRLEQQKDDFLAIVSHELRTPLTAIKGYAQLALRAAERQGDMRIAHAVRIIDERADHLTRLSAEMLDVSYVQDDALPLKRERFDLGLLVRGIVRAIERVTPQCVFSVRAPNSPVIVEGDRDRIEQVMVTLLENAVKYTDLRGEKDCPIEIEVRVEGDEAITSVQDYGVGISADQQSQVFTRFFRARNIEQQGHPYPGVGLGLYIAHGIIVKHGGRIWVVSREAEGSVFGFGLPLAAQ